MNANPATPEPNLRSATNRDAPAIAALIFAVLDELELEPDRARLAAGLAHIESTHTARRGGFWVLEATPDGIVGCVALLAVDATTVELQRMYLPPEWRGCGQGRRLLTHALAEARRLGYLRVVLDTSHRMAAALALYRRSGFTPMPRRGAWSHCDLAFERKLDQTGSDENDRHRQ